jgi:hypothetical protein
MTRQELIDSLTLNHKEFVLYFRGLRDEDFTFSLNNEKWSAAQHADHILRSLSPVRMLFGLPKWMGRLFFKKANRPSKSYEDLIKKYLLSLERGGRASGRFVPEKVGAGSKAALAKRIEATVQKLCSAVSRYSEKELDRLVLPHPLLGRVTLREMLYFTIYHVRHHQSLAARDLAKK